MVKSEERESTNVPARLACPEVVMRAGDGVAGPEGGILIHKVA